MSACAAAHDKRLLVAHKMRCHRGFDTHLVNRVNHKIKRQPEKLGKVALVHKVFYFNHLASRVDLRDALAQGGYFGFAKIGGERVDLAVYIGFGDIVQINQRELTDSAAGKRFHRPRADTAHSHHANVRVLQGVQTVFAVKPCDAAEAAVGMCFHVAFPRKFR